MSTARSALALILGFFGGSPLCAAHADSMPGMPMSSSISLTDPMEREGSGTSWLPDSTPMYGKMIMRPNGDMLMIHGAAMPRYTDVGSKRGDRRIDSPNWLMGMLGHPLSADSQLGLRAMISLDPLTEGGYGYPLLYQTGETWHHVPLHDRQHPHDLFDELSATYSHTVGGGRSAYLHVGYPGEPALGPPTYMHRLMAYDLADAPIGHHWQDATHVTFGVATAGYEMTHDLKIEASRFTGREPDENRWNFDRPRFDSSSTRLDWNPDTRDALQLSYGFVRNPEGDGRNQHRTTASWIYDRPLGSDSNLTTTLVWGQNTGTGGEGISNSYLEEADYQAGRDTLFSRLEQIQKSGAELSLPAPFDTSKKYWLGEYTVGYVRDLTHGQGVDTGLGAAVTLGSDPASLDRFYGSSTPVSFQIFLRFRPSRAKMQKAAMSGMRSMPGMPTTVGKGATNLAEALTHASSIVIGDTGPKASNGSGQAWLRLAVTLMAPESGLPTVITVSVLDSHGNPIDTTDIAADVSMTTMDMGTMHPTFKRISVGHYQAQIRFPMAGEWRITVHAKLSNGDTVSSSGTLTF